jgi:hypothetical protein
MKVIMTIMWVTIAPPHKEVKFYEMYPSMTLCQLAKGVIMQPFTSLAYRDYEIKNGRVLMNVTCEFDSSR